MSILASWLAEVARGRSWLQHGGLGDAGLCLTPAALHAGARHAWHVEGQELPAQAWDRLLDACRPHEDRLTTLCQDAHDGEAMAARVPVVDIGCVIGLFHQRDPYRVLHNIARHARRHLVVASCVVPDDADGLPPGEQVAGNTPDDPRLAAVRRVLERRALEMPQFRAAPAGHDARGRPYWHGMWHWFQTEPALRAMVEQQGWRVVRRQAVWLDVGLVLVAERG